MSAPVTVLMPNYNNGPFLKEAIDSILDQTFRNYELLIVDDGSTDNSIEVINSYSDNRIKLVRKEKNSGIVDALNIGLDLIQSKYMVRMDGDDLSVPDRLEKLFQFMEENPAVGICSSQLERFGEVEAIDKLELDTERIKAKFIHSTPVLHAGAIMRMSVLNENKIRYRAVHPYMEDYDLFFRLKNFASFVTLDHVLYRYRILKHNSTVKNSGTLLARYYNFYSLNVFPELGIDANEENLRLHTELCLWPDCTFPYKRYRDWMEFLLRRNKTLKVYPQKALEEELKAKFNRFYYLKVADRSILQSIKYFLEGGKADLPKVTYLCKLKINKIIGRNTQAQTHS